MSTAAQTGVDADSSGAALAAYGADSAAAAEALTPRCLLVSSDRELVNAVLPLFASTGIAAEVCPELELARQKLTTHRFDAAALDCGSEQMLSAVAELRKSPATRNLVLLAFLERVRLNSGLPAANFAIEKPVSSELASKVIQTSFRFMLAERRRYFRMTVDIPVSLTFGEERFMATAVNLSDGGMGIVSTRALERGRRGSIQFRLPISGEQISVSGEISWSDTEGHAGFRFSSVPDSVHRLLDDWLARAAHGQVIPAAVAQQKAAEAQRADAAPRRDRAQPAGKSLPGRLLTGVLALFILFVLAFWLALAGVGSIVVNLVGLALAIAVVAAGTVVVKNYAA